MLDELAVLASLGVKSRRAEVGAIESEIARLRPTERISLPAAIEGGDVMRVGRKLYVGLSPRTNEAGAEALRRLAAPHRYEVVAVKLRDCLHLKTACTALDDATILFNPEWVDASVFANYELIAVDRSEPWAANTLRVGQMVCVSAAFPRTAELLSRRDYDVCAINVSEFAKAEGGLTCMSLIFNSE